MKFGIFQPITLNPPTSPIPTAAAALAAAILIFVAPFAPVSAQDFQSAEKNPPALPANTKSTGDTAPAFPAINPDAATPVFPGDKTDTLYIDIPFNDPAALAQLPAALLASAVAATNPQGENISATTLSLTRNGTAWTPVMGAFDYALVPADEWRTELLKIKSGGMDIVATEIFWAQHEPSQGHYNWTGDCDLRHFVQTCATVDMQVVLHIGPHNHGPLPNGALPDWLLATGCRPRTDDSRYLENVRTWFAQIAAQTKGLLWKDGGPIIGVQLESEYSGSVTHLLTLKKIAIDTGILVPLYTRTAWPTLPDAATIPHGMIIPTYNATAEGYWDREMKRMPGNTWTNFRFTTARGESEVLQNLATKTQAPHAATSAPAETDTLTAPLAYPYLTSEINSGMASSYHRRILSDPRDAESIALVKLGDGSVSTGYYIYHGGIPPDSAQRSTPAAFSAGSFALPQKNYDYQAPIGAAGQTRPHYDLLRRQNLFMHDFGYLLPGMPTILPSQRPNGPADNTTLRWALRSNGRSGFIFVNNYQRQQYMPEHRGVQFQLNLPPIESISPTPSGIGVTSDDARSNTALDSKRRAAIAQAESKRFVPIEPVNIPADCAFIWPFNLDLGDGAILAYATVQPLCFIDTPDDKTRTYFFSEIPDISPELAFTDVTVRLLAFGSGRQRTGNGLERITAVKTGRARALTLHSPNPNARTIQIVVLTYKDSLNLYKLNWGDGERVIISPHPVIIEPDETLRVFSPDPNPAQIAVYPIPAKPVGKKKNLLSRIAAFIVQPLTDAIKESSGIFTTLTVPGAPDPSVAQLGADAVHAEKIASRGAPASQVKTSYAAVPPTRQSSRAPSNPAATTAGTTRSKQPESPLPAAPAEADFENTPVWKINLSADALAKLGHARQQNANALLRIRYTGDVARVLLDGKVIFEDFYNGAPLELPLTHILPQLASGAQLTLEILPLRKDSPIYMADAARPRFGMRSAIAELGKIEIEQIFTHTLIPTASDSAEPASE